MRHIALGLPEKSVYSGGILPITYSLGHHMAVLDCQRPCVCSIISMPCIREAPVKVYQGEG